jgi:hypothetical protein
MKMIHRPKDTFSKELPAQASHYERNKDMRARIKRIQSPDTTKMIALHVPDIRAIFYFKAKSKLNRKITQLKAAGYNYEVK